jgi:hypothetical protein
MCGATPSYKLLYLLVYNPSKTLMKMEFCSSTYRCKFNTKKNIVHVDSTDESILNYIWGFSLINHPAIGYFMETRSKAPGHKGSTGTAGDSPAAESKPAALGMATGDRRPAYGDRFCQVVYLP